MNKFMTTLAAASIAFGGAAYAGTITVSAFDITSFDAATDYSGFVVEDFEAIGAATGAGQLPGDLDTGSVGTFAALDGVGTGTTCSSSGGAPGCTNLYLSDQLVNGQGNLVPDDGEWSLNANDTFGMLWSVVKEEGGSLFNRVVFAMMDAADVGATVTVKTSTDSAVFSGLSNANSQLIVIDFASLVDTASIKISSSKLNDSFSVDGASVGVVPLPAGGLLLLTGLGALTLRRRRKSA